MADKPDFTNGQPSPVPNSGESMHDLVMEDLIKRRNSNVITETVFKGCIEHMAERKYYGMAKYDTILQAYNGRDFFKDAIEEAVDLLVYLRGASIENPDNEGVLHAYELALDTFCVLERVIGDRSKG